MPSDRFTVEWLRSKPFHPYSGSSQTQILRPALCAAPANPASGRLFVLGLGDFFIVGLGAALGAFGEIDLDEANRLRL